MIHNIFVPNLTAYNDAQSAGNLSMLKNKSLMVELTKFIDEYDNLKKIVEEIKSTYYNGSTWEFRKTEIPGTIYNSYYSISPERKYLIQNIYQWLQHHWH